jgi:hypothetical protein
MTITKVTDKYQEEIEELVWEESQLNFLYTPINFLKALREQRL